MGRKVGDWYHYTGVIHIHTTESDGTKSLEESVVLGREVGLDFMMFADHMNLNNRHQGKEGFYGKTLVVIGYEHNDQNDRHHYLLFGSPGVYPRHHTPREFVAAGAADDAVGILAHPDEIRHKVKRFPPYPWTDWTAEGYTGIEIWNQMSEWMERLTRYNLPVMAFSPRKSMIGPSDRILCRWDELNLKRRVVGIASADAHAFPIRVGPLTVRIFPYKVHFKCLRTNLVLSEPLSSDFERARDQLYNGLRHGSVFFSNVRWGATNTFLFYAEGGGRRVPSGGRLELADDTHLVVKLPCRARVRLVHNGKYILKTTTGALEYQVAAPGTYRVEAWQGRRGWIFSNHVRIGI